jgi:hypothetical protein
MKIKLRLQNGWADFENADNERCDIDGTRLWMAPHGGRYCDRVHTPEQINAREVSEHITTEKSDPDAWHCICGNTPGSDGFFPCDENGNEMEPSKGSGWDGLYVCARCGRIIKQDTLEVIGRNEQHARLP